MATTTATTPRVRPWMAFLVLVLLIGALVGAFALFERVTLREAPPVEAIAFERTTLDEGVVHLSLRNDGPDPVTIAQVLVNDAYWTFSVDDASLSRLESTDLRIDYPWEEGLPVNIALVTSTGVTIEHEIEAATLTPEADASSFLTYGLLGVYIGVIPVAVGLFAFPLLRRMSRSLLGFFLAFTVGLLAFLLVDTVGEGFELASETAAALDGLGLFFIGVLCSVAALLWLEGWLDRRKRATSDGESAPLRLAYLIAAGIGLHNLGEGLAVGAALAAGEIALGTFLVVGFALHNTTEGLAIVSPLGARPSRPSLAHFAALGAVAGAPTILGAWLGGFAFSPAWATFAFGVAAGAIGQVIWAIARGMRGEASLNRGLPTIGFLVGLAVMYGTGLLIA